MKKIKINVILFFLILIILYKLKYHTNVAYTTYISKDKIMPVVL